MRQRGVEQHHLRIERVRKTQRFVAVGRFADDEEVGLVAQADPQLFAGSRMAVRDNDADRFEGRTTEWGGPRWGRCRLFACSLTNSRVVAEPLECNYTKESTRPVCYPAISRNRASRWAASWHSKSSIHRLKKLPFNHGQRGPHRGDGSGPPLQVEGEFGSVFLIASSWRWYSRSIASLSAIGLLSSRRGPEVNRHLCRVATAISSVCLSNSAVRVRLRILRIFAKILPGRGLCLCREPWN
jgi:hypothetical protein